MAKMLLLHIDEGDEMTKAFLVYRSLKLHAISGVNKDTLPVFRKVVLILLDEENRYGDKNRHGPDRANDHPIPVLGDTSLQREDYGLKLLVRNGS
ncbi:hypothetical protein NPIL_495371 [Nephila pilipes]|uniref:Uncharacterized protein n=1 Tax=Nephila pilipes TaxID=299642 RepID=A0A8X6MIJ1_NEPPI|nr:hypothetical protein NPIL_495371 [Nephila pilipes]